MKALLAAAVALAATSSLHAATLVVTDSTSADALVNKLVAGSVVSVVPGSALLVGNSDAGGAQQGFFSTSVGGSLIGFPSGLMLTSGYIKNVIGPNILPDISKDWAAPGTGNLDNLSAFPTHDANVLSFDFTLPSTPPALTFQYVFASDEYDEWVDTQYNDVFAFIVDGTNIALLPGNAPVTINTVNFHANTALYRDNALIGGVAPINTEMDGLTHVLAADVTSALKPGLTTHHMELSIADASDGIYDSAVFLRAGSFTATGSSKDNPDLPDYDPSKPITPGTSAFTDDPSDSYFDPLLLPAKKYTYLMTGGAKFTGILDFPIDSDAPFTVTVNGQVLGTFAPGDTLDFTSLFPDGVTGFDITGITPYEPDDSPQPFALKLAFNAPTASFLVTTAAVPEPASLTLLALGAVPLLLRRRRPTQR